MNPKQFHVNMNISIFPAETWKTEFFQTNTKIYSLPPNVTLSGKIKYSSNNAVHSSTALTNTDSFNFYLIKAITVV